MKILPVGKQNFADIIQRNMLYVDKTHHVHRLIELGDLYFLARPRRFGKSLLVSTFYNIFRGKRELFTDLYIGKETNYDFPVHPVLEFGFASYGYKVTNLRENLNLSINKYASTYEIELPKGDLSSRFTALITAISEKEKPIVLLVDEYDKPIVDFLTDVEQAKQNQKVLRDFFSPLKELERRGHLRFLFITGVSKFSKVSLFSDLNNLTDLSTNFGLVANELLGITHQELLANFQPHLAHAAEELGMERDYLLAGIKLWYNGYSFDGETKLYNPYSLLHFFLVNDFKDYWFATGTPTFLVESIREQKIDPHQLERVSVAGDFFNKFSLEKLDMIGLLFQTGYLTIKEVERRGYRKSYYLGYPNEEVRSAFVHNLLEAFTFRTDSVVGGALTEMEKALNVGNVDEFITQLKVLLADIPYYNHPTLPKTADDADSDNFAAWEGYFHTIVYLVTVFIRLQVKSEIAKHQGRLDLIAESEDYLYLMEFKLDEPAENAIQQIKNREYAAAYRNTTKTLVLVGVGFSRNMKEWKQEVWELPRER